MNFVRPTRCVWKQDRNAVLLTYEGEESDLTDYYHVRGGIAWPRQVMAGGRHHLRGFCCIGCQRVSDGTVFILAEQSYAAIDNVYEPEGKVIHEGLSQFLNAAWTNMMCNRLYHRESQETHRRYWLQLKRSDLMRDLPMFTDVFWDDENEARCAILEARQVGRLMLDEDGELWKALKTWKAQPDSMNVEPEIHALTCLLRGLVEYPWRQPDLEETIVRIR